MVPPKKPGKVARIYSVDRKELDEAVKVCFKSLLPLATDEMLYVFEKMINEEQCKRCEAANRKR